MSEYKPLEGRTHLNPPGFCIIPGCTSASVTSRRVLLGSGAERDVEVCSTHSEGDLDLDWISELGD